MIPGKRGGHESPCGFHHALPFPGVCKQVKAGLGERSGGIRSSEVFG